LDRRLEEGRRWLAAACGACLRLTGLPGRGLRAGPLCIWAEIIAGPIVLARLKSCLLAWLGLLGTASARY
jgi:hypothetical protein